VAEPVPGQISRGAFAAGVLGVAVVAAVSVAPSLGGGLLELGDRSRVAANPRTKSLSKIFSVEGEGNCTPFGELGYALDRAVLGDSPAWLRRHGLLSAALFAALAALVAAKVTGSRAAGLVAGVIFAVHPLAVEPGSWIAARTIYSAGILLALSALLCMPGADGPESHGPGRIIGATLLFAAACLTHPIALAYPLLLLVLAAFPVRADAAEQPFRVRIRPLAAMVVPGLAFGILHALTSAPDAASRDLELAGGPAAYVLRCFAATGRTLVGIVLPARLAPDYSSGLTTSGAFGVVSMLFLVALGALSWRLRRNVPALAVFTGWTVATVLPAAALTGGFGGDRYAVFAVLAAAILAAELLRLLWARASSGGRLVAGAAVAAAAIAMLISSLILSATWRDDRSIWLRVIKMRPDSPGAHLNLGRLYSKTSSDLKTDDELLRDATAAAVRANELGASEPACRLLLGRIHLRWGNYGEASKHFAAVISLTNEMDAAEQLRLVTGEMLAEALVGLGNIYELAYAPYETRRGPPRREAPPSGEDTVHLAKASYEQALKYRPERPDALLGLGRILNRLGEFDEAAATLERAAALAPDNARVHWELGSALESSLQFKKAEKHYLLAAKLDDLSRRYAKSVQRVKGSIGSARRYQGEKAEQVRMEALALFRKGLKREARGVALLAKGSRVQARPELMKAYEAFKGAASRRLDLAAAHQRAGACAFRLGWYENAKTHLDAADLYQPDNLVTVYLLARTELKLARLNHAEARLNECRSINKKFGPAYLWLARLEFFKEEPDYDDALIHVRSAENLGMPGAAKLRTSILKLKSGQTYDERPAPPEPRKPDVEQKK